MWMVAIKDFMHRLENYNIHTEQHYKKVLLNNFHFNGPRWEKFTQPL